jgi:class 3 adenylate cyclase/tetratricopeptide (TPR) repeat protein
MTGAPAAVRKTVSVLFCDLVESTALGDGLDPETLRGLLSRWHTEMREPVERHGGTVEKFIGDALMAVFGIPHVHEDDALRAVRAAVEMRAALERLNDNLAAQSRGQLQIRIGINTGEVVTGDGSTTLVTGDAVNTAKRLEEAAHPNEILVGEATRRLVSNATEVEAVPAVQAKGKSAPVGAWRIVGTIAGATAFARRLDAPLVGRTRELAFLRAELDETSRASSCRLVTVYGVAGIGKSRLAAELAAAVGDGAALVSARCLPYGDGITFLPVTELVRSAGGEQAVVAAVRSEPDGDLIAERICGALGAEVSAEETFWAIRRLLETLARERPLVVCLEDVHWGQPMFLDLVEYIAGWSRDAPILLLCLARPDLLDERPRWPGASLTLEPLTPAESQALLDELAAEWPLPAAARSEIAEAAEGNPLYVEQMVALLAEGERADAVPPTIQALLAARLDRLEPLERAALERAAVVGKELSRSAIAQLSPDDERPALGATLLSLVRKELLRPERGARPGDDGFRFRHALIRDAAYGEIPKATRADLHERFADWLAGSGGEDDLVGHHLERASQYLAELGTADEALSARAAAMLAAAGRRAFARDDARAAVSLFLRACELLPSDDAARLEPLRRASLALWWTGNVDEARRLLDEQIALASRLGNAAEEWSGRLDLAAGDLVTGRIDADVLLDIAKKAISVFEADDDAGLARAWRRVAHAYMAKGRYADSGEASERALAHARAGSERFEEARIVDLLCTSLLYGPAPADEAVLRCEAMLVEAHGNRVLGANVAAALVGLLAMRGAFDAARERARFAEEIYLELDLQLAFAGLTQVTGPMELLAGEAAAAERELQRGLEILRPRGPDAYQEALLAEALYQQGRFDDAATHARTSEAHAPADNVQAQVAWRGVRAKLEAADSPERARVLVAEAVSLAEATDATNLLADALADLAVVLHLARDDAVEDVARRAVALYEQKGNVAAAHRLSQVLTAVG